jgi:hypothetical protein
MQHKPGRCEFKQRPGTGISPTIKSNAGASVFLSPKAAYRLRSAESRCSAFSNFRATAGVWKSPVRISRLVESRPQSSLLVSPSGRSVAPSSEEAREQPARTGIRQHFRVQLCIHLPRSGKMRFSEEAFVSRDLIKIDARSLPCTPAFCGSCTVCFGYRGSGGPSRAAAGWSDLIKGTGNPSDFASPARPRHFFIHFRSFIYGRIESMPRHT